MDNALDYAGLAALVTAVGSIILGILNTKKQKKDGGATNGRIGAVEARLTSALQRIDILDGKLEECEAERLQLVSEVKDLKLDNYEQAKEIRELKRQIG